MLRGCGTGAPSTGWSLESAVPGFQGWDCFECRPPFDWTEDAVVLLRADNCVDIVIL